MSDVMVMEAPGQRRQRPQRPLHDPESSRGSSDPFERRYMFSVLASADVLDGFPVDIEAGISSDAIRTVLRAVEALRREGKPTTRERVQAWISSHESEPMRGAALRVSDEPPDFADDLDPVAHHLRSSALARRLRREAREIEAAVSAGHYGRAEAIASRIHEISQESAPDNTRVSVREAMRLAMPPKHDPNAEVRVERIVRFEEQFEPRRVRLMRGETLVLGAGTNVGKSTLVDHWARRAAMLEQRTLVISCEDTEELYGRKQLAARAQISMSRIADGEISDQEREDAERVIETTNDPLDIVRVRNKSVVNVCRWIRRAGAEGATLVAVDYLQAIKPDREFMQRKSAVDYVLNEVISAAATANVALILASQLARMEKGTKAREPELYDLKESGDIENCATYVVFAWQKRADAFGRILGKVSKNKSGGFRGEIDGWQRDRETEVVRKYDSSRDDTRDESEEW